MKTRSKKIDESLTRLLELQSQIDQLQEEVDKIKSTVQEVMGEEEELITAHHVVKWTHISSRRFDSSAFRQSYPDMYESFKKVSESRRFSFN